MGGERTTREMSSTGLARAGGLEGVDGMSERRARAARAAAGSDYATSVLGETRAAYSAEWRTLKVESLGLAGRVGRLARETSDEVSRFVGAEGEHFIRWVGERAGDVPPFLAGVAALVPDGAGTVGVVKAVASAILDGAGGLLEGMSRSATVREASTQWNALLQATVEAQGAGVEEAVSLGTIAFEGLGAVGGQLEALLAPGGAEAAVAPPDALARRIEEDLAGGHDFDVARLDDLDAETERRVAAADMLAFRVLGLLADYKARLGQLEGDLMKLVAERTRRWDALRAGYARAQLDSGAVDLRVMLHGGPGRRASLSLTRLAYPRALSAEMRAFLASRTVGQLCDESRVQVMLRVEGVQAGLVLKPGAPPEVVRAPEAFAVERLGLDPRHATALALRVGEQVRETRIRDLARVEVGL